MKIKNGKVIRIIEKVFKRKTEEELRNERMDKLWWEINMKVLQDKQQAYHREQPRQ